MDCEEFGWARRVTQARQSSISVESGSSVGQPVRPSDADGHQEDVPTTAAADDIDPAVVRDGGGVLSTAVELDPEEDRPNSPRSSLIDDLQHEMNEGPVGDRATLGRRRA